MQDILKAAKVASKKLALLSEEQRNSLLINSANALLDKSEEILAANKLDLNKATHLSEAMKDRLRLDYARIEAMANGLKKVSAQPAVVGQILSKRELASGIHLEQISVPFGVVGIIYEARPNVSADAFALAIKSANAVVLKGGSEALYSNEAIIKCLAQCAAKAGVEGAVGFINNTSREAIDELLQAYEYIDVLIPRGGAGLINAVRKGAKMSVIATGVGNCHIYVHEAADLTMALSIIKNAKLSRPSVCNAVECVLVDAKRSAELIAGLKTLNIELRGCEILSERFNLPLESDWDSEYLAPILRIKQISNIDEALAHIAAHSSQHSEAIITQDSTAAQRFVQEVDAACVYVNASTRFSDGECFGLGAEIGISTQKMHARGPMGAQALTTYKYILKGNGEIRN